jgi:hypothetical protein
MRTIIFLALLFWGNLLAQKQRPFIQPSFVCDIPDGLLVTNMTGTAATLSWNAVNGAYEYTLEIQDDQVETSTYHTSTIVKEPTYSVTGLDANVLYKFRVSAQCDASKGAWSPWFIFELGIGNQGEIEDLTRRLTYQPAPTTFEASSIPINIANRNAALESFPFLVVQLWPNPAHTNVSVRLQNLEDERTILRLFDASGHLVQEQFIQPGTKDWEGQLLLSDLHEGLYLLQTENGPNKQTAKLMVNH